jgi:uncharacterized membrane protein
MSEANRGFHDTDFESSPLTRTEYISALVHFYRGEVTRSNAWRQRLDQTTNWAVVMSAAMITFAFSEENNTHLLLLLSNFIAFGFLAIEARRFRFFAVYRARVRMLEENFLLPILTRQLISPKPEWRDFIAMDLDVPKFKNTLFEAFALRLRYNFYWIFTTLVVAWLMKTWLHPSPAHSLADWYRNMQIGAIPGWAFLLLGAVFYSTITAMFVWAGRNKTVSEDEIHGYESDRKHWKF